MNLALITQDFPPDVGGIETYTTEVAKRFASQCESFFVMAPDNPGAGKVDQDLPYSVHRISSNNSFLGFKALPEAPPLFRKYSTKNVFHTQWQTLPLTIFAHKQGVVDNIFVAAHGRELLFNPFYRYSVLRKAFEQYKRWILSHVDLFFPVSAYTANLLCRHGVDSKRIKIVINGTDADKFYPQSSKNARKAININTQKVLLSITRLVSRKGIGITLKAFKKVLQNHPDSCYVIVGEGPQKTQLQELAARLQIGNAVKFAGRIPNKELINYYNACDVFVMPSKTEVPNVEGFGIVFLEANACEKPVIGTFSGGIASAVVDGETGILVKENDTEALANAIDKLFAEPGLALNMGKKGRKRIKMSANWNVTAAKLLNNMKSKI